MHGAVRRGVRLDFYASSQAIRSDIYANGHGHFGSAGSEGRDHGLDPRLLPMSVRRCTAVLVAGAYCLTRLASAQQS